MRTREVVAEPGRKLSLEPEAERLSVVVADGSAQFLETVFAVLEFDQIVEIVGRAQDFEETIELAISLQPDLILLDIEMASAPLAIAAILLSAADSKIVGMAADSNPLRPPSLILSLSALIHRSRLREEFLPVLHALCPELPRFALRWLGLSLRHPPEQVHTPWLTCKVNDSKEEG
jgi:CheY-like chemotaxis protein